MSYKNIIGWCLVGSWTIAWMGRWYYDAFQHFGWWSLVAFPLEILSLVAVIAFVGWLLD